MAQLRGVVVYRISLPGDWNETGAWLPGPLPVEVALTQGSPEKSTATASWREQFVLPKVARVLYSQDLRFHREPIGGVLPPDASSLAFADLGGELLLLDHLPPLESPGRRCAVVAIHLQLARDFPADDRGANAVVGRLKDMARDLNVMGDKFEAVRTHLPPGAELIGGFKSAVLGLFLDSPVWGDDPEDAGNVLRRWSLAMASPLPKSALSDPAPPVKPGRVLTLTRRSAYVVRDGLLLTVLKSSPTKKMEWTGAFSSIYVDGLLLLAAQELFLEIVADETATIGDPAAARRNFAATAGNLRSFRNRWWWREYSHWEFADDAIRALQEKGDLDHKYESLRADHEFFAATVDATETALVNRLVLLLSVIGVLGTVASVQALFPSDLGAAANVLILVVTLVVSTVVAIAIYRGWSFRRRR